tara:strand:+ start:359 stop:562 length:204 start_codon:yes stop_codon:yes gene_type:complete
VSLSDLQSTDHQLTEEEGADRSDASLQQSIGTFRSKLAACQDAFADPFWLAGSFRKVKADNGPSKGY